MIGGALGLSYYAFNHYTAGKIESLTLNQVRKLMQEIKHQILIVCINFTEGSKDSIGKLKR